MQKNYKSVISCKLDQLIENYKNKDLSPSQKRISKMANKNEMILNFMRQQGNEN